MNIVYKRPNSSKNNASKFIHNMLHLHRFDFRSHQCTSFYAQLAYSLMPCNISFLKTPPRSTFNYFKMPFCVTMLPLGVKCGKQTVDIVISEFEHNTNWIFRLLHLRLDSALYYWNCLITQNTYFSTYLH